MFETGSSDAGMQIILQMGDRFLLCEDRLLYHIVDGNNAAEPVILEYRQVPDVLVRQQLHTEINGVLWFDVGQVVGHDLFHFCIRGGFAFEDHFPGIIPFSHYAHVLLAFEDKHRANILIGHDP